MHWNQLEREGGGGTWSGVREEEGSELVELGLGFRKGAGRGRGASGGKLRKGGIASAIGIRPQLFSLARYLARSLTGNQGID